MDPNDLENVAIDALLLISDNIERIVDYSLVGELIRRKLEEIYCPNSKKKILLILDGVMMSQTVNFFNKYTVIL